MANELVINYPTGATLYALLFDATGQVWNGSAFEAVASANWLNYDIAMSEVATATGVYLGTMPAAAAGVYGWTVRKQAGGSPAVSDITVGTGRIEWSGTAEIMPAQAGDQMDLVDAPNATAAAAIAAAILVTPANKLATLANGEIVISPETVVAAYVNNTSPTAQQEIRDAMQFAPTDAGDTQAGSIDDKLDDILVDTGTTIPGLLAGVGSGSGTGYYSDTVDDGTSPLDGVRVQLYTAADRVGLAYEAYTDALGVFEMWPDTGTYYRWLDLAGYSFTQDVEVEVTEP